MKLEGCKNISESKNISVCFENYLFCVLRNFLKFNLFCQGLRTFCSTAKFRFCLRMINVEQWSGFHLWEECWCVQAWSCTRASCWATGSTRGRWSAAPCSSTAWRDHQMTSPSRRCSQTKVSLHTSHSNDYSSVKAATNRQSLQQLLASHCNDYSPVIATHRQS